MLKSRHDLHFLIAKSHSNGHHPQSNPEPPIRGLAITS